MEIENIPISEIVPYENNPRKNDSAVGIVAKSIKEFGFRVPIILDDKNIIVCGHTRVKAAIKLGMTEVPAIYAEGLTDEQIKAFRIMDNKTQEYAKWDEDLLKEELNSLKDAGFDISLTGFDEGTLIEEYSQKIKSPIYEITRGKPLISELFNVEKTKRLIKEIEKSNVSEQIKDFLRYAAYRHIVFNYENIAEFYAHSDEEVQKLMEDSALVIIDFDKAIEDGFIKLSETLADKFLEQKDEEWFYSIYLNL